MANDLYTPEQVARVAVSMAREGSRLSPLVSRNFENDLLGGGGKGRSVNLRVPTTLVARHRGIDDVTNKIVLDYIAETTVSVTLGTHAYSAVGLSEGDLTLDLTDFSAQILAPQVDAVVADIDLLVADTVNAEPHTAIAGHTYSAANPVATFTQIRRVLVQDKGVDPSALNVLVAPDVYAHLLDANAIQDASQSGSTAALREGQVGRVRGMTVVESGEIDDGKIVAFHRDAYALAVRAPVVPKGVAFGQTIQERSFALRYMRDYDADYTQDRSIVGTFVGMVKMPLYKVTRTRTQNEEGDVDDAGTTGVNEAYQLGTATVSQVAGGAVLAFDTTV